MAKIIIYPRPDSTSSVWGKDVLGSIDMAATNLPSESISRHTVAYLFKTIESNPDYQKKDGNGKKVPKIPIYTEYENRNKNQ
jgi:hypothetical protein